MVNDILADSSAIRGGTIKSMELKLNEDLITNIWDEIQSKIYDSASHCLFQTMINKDEIKNIIKDNEVTVNFVCDYIAESLIWLNYKVSVTEDVIIINW